MTKVRVLICIITSVLLSATLQAQETELGGSVQPADVLLVVQDIGNELESIRRFMGKPALGLNRLHVDFAAPKHVFYQAQTMFRKVNRLGSEVAGVTRQSPPPAPELTKAILPQDVLRIVRLVQGQTSLISNSLGIVAEEKNTRRNPRTQPVDVFEEVVHINRQVNLMIDEPFRSSDVYEQLSLISAYIAGNLASIGKDPFPAVEFVPNQQPVDVYDALIDTLFLNQKIGEKLGIPVIRINSKRLKREYSLLSDNYDLATMLLSDVATWTEKMPAKEDMYPPGDQLRNIFSSHVLVKASMVRQQLGLILEHLHK